ncbi:MAG: serine/threonine-protein kinase [Acidobacteriota bacterium]
MPIPESPTARDSETEPEGSSTAMLCYGCNERRAADLRVCPDCGGTLVAVDDVDLLATRTLTETTRPNAPWAKDELVGQSFGPYEMKALLGQGGMGRVYRAHHSGLGRTSAIKVLNPQLVSKRPTYARLFVQEARAAAALVHPNVVTVHNIIELDGYWMIEMEWVDGAPLHRAWQAGPQSTFRATKLMHMLASGLAAAHHRDIVHRDLKPSNVLVNDADVAKLADFGLAKRVVAQAREEAGIDLAGTPYFMAPELFSGASATQRSDVYAAGITFHYLLTGSYPFRARTFSELVLMHRNEEPPRIEIETPTHSRRIQRILDRCLAKDPDERYTDSGALAGDLQVLLGSLRDLESLIMEAFEDLEVQPRAVPDGFEIEIALPGGRRQTVYVAETRSTFDNERLVRIWSPCGPVDDGYLLRALQINGEVYHGALAIQEFTGRPYFVMRNNYPSATCDPAEIRSSVLAIAKRSDEVESMLTGKDIH